MVTCLSSIASRRADWVFGGDLLISSASSMWVKTGPFSRTNPASLILQTLVPMMSEGMRSGVNCTLFHWQPVIFPKVFARRVFPRPG